MTAKAAWISGTPLTNPEGYASRGGLTTVENLLTPLLLIHAELDARCRVNQARNYIEQARQVGKGTLITYLMRFLLPYSFLHSDQPRHWGHPNL